MKFQDRIHEVTFRKFMAEAGAGCNDPEYLASLFVLSSNLLYGRTERYVGHMRIRFMDLVRDMECWSSGEKSLVLLAAALFNSSWKADLNYLFWNLDDKNVELALEALKIRFKTHSDKGLKGSSLSGITSYSTKYKQI